MHRSGVGAISVALMLLLGLVTLPGRAFAADPDEVALVVQYDDGQVDSLCIALEEDEISGADLLIHSGLDLVVDTSRMGVTICQIQEVGCAYPAKACFCQCMGGGDCAYWNYFYRDPGEVDWNYSALGAAIRWARPGSVEAWVWGDGRTPPDDNLTFETICPPPEPTATQVPPTSTSPPATDTPAATFVPTGALTLAVSETPTRTPSHTPTVLPSASHTPPAPTPSPTAAASQGLVSYWPFGLILAGLAAAAVFVWLRRV